MRIIIGADHRGYQIKGNIVKYLKSKNADVVDVGIHQNGIMVDYPLIAYKVGQQVAGSKQALGILICMTGLGQVIAANKIRGVYAALCYNAESAAFARQHNNANIIVLSAKYMKKRDVTKIINSFLTARFEGGRHRRRFEQIKKLEKGLALK